MQPPRGRPDFLGNRRREGDHVVLRGLLDFLDAGDVECAALANLSGGIGRHDPGGGHRFGRRDFDQQPGLVPTLVAPDAAHFGVGVSRNHPSALTDRTQKPTAQGQRLTRLAREESH